MGSTLILELGTSLSPLCVLPPGEHTRPRSTLGKSEIWVARIKTVASLSVSFQDLTVLFCSACSTSFNFCSVQLVSQRSVPVKEAVEVALLRKQAGDKVTSCFFGFALLMMTLIYGGAYSQAWDS